MANSLVWKKIFAVTLIALLSCTDFLDIKPKGIRYEEEFYNRKGVEALLIGAYAHLTQYGMEDGAIFVGWEAGPSNWIYGSLVGGEAHTGSTVDDPIVSDIMSMEQFRALPTNPFLNAKWVAAYAGIARTDEVLRVLSKVTDISDEDSNRIAGEARALRGIYYLEAKKMWNMIPYVSETSDRVSVKNDVDIWDKIEADFLFAYTTLPEDMDEVGRVNKWAAGAFYAKTLIFQRKFPEARVVLENIYQNGKNPAGVKYGLFPHFDDAFNVEKENAMESVFAVQYSANDGTALPDGSRAGDILNFPVNSFSCCGFFQPSFELVNSYRTGGDGLPLLDGSYNLPGNEVKTDLGLESTEPFSEDGGNVDPRLDWTVGRRGIPYYDWGEHPGRDWIRDQRTFGPYSPKKYIYRMSQQGQFTETQSWKSGFTANNFVVIRFAEIILWLAECEAEIGSLDKARLYVNEIRQRAANSDGWVKDADGSNAAKYAIGVYPSGFPFDSKENARKAVHFESKLELAMEGRRFFDLVRWGEAEQTINAYLEYEREKLEYLQISRFTGGTHEYYPIPQTQIDLTGTLKQNLGYD